MNYFIKCKYLNQFRSEKNKCFEYLVNFKDRIYTKLEISGMKTTQFKKKKEKLKIQKQQNFMIIFTYLLLVKRYYYSFKFTSKNYDSKLLDKYNKMLNDTCLLALAQECNIAYKKIHKFLLVLQNSNVMCTRSFKKKVTKFLRNIKILFRNAYFQTIIHHNSDRGENEISNILIDFLSDKTS